MESIITYLIYFHAIFGFLALVSGLMAIFAYKGKNIHKKSGKFFYYTMLISGITAMCIAVLPNHENPFLFAIGIFSLYLVFSGYRALRFKKSTSNLQLDKWVSRVMILTGILMIFLPIILTHNIHIILAVFGIFGIILSVKDLMLFKKTEQLKKAWLKLHIGKIVGGYISAVTAFVVVNQFFPSIYGWFIPSVIGAAYITYWQIRVNRQA